MISVKNVTKRYGARALFERVSLRFDLSKRYGIVGANGAGKSTLLRMITGEESFDEGEIYIPGNFTLGSLNQDHFAFEDVALMDVVLRGKPALANALEAKHHAIENHDIPPERIAELEEIIADNDGYVAESRISEMLEGLGIPGAKHLQPMSELSGGYKLRVLLAQCLFSDPDALLLDEPTNHLDIFSIRWLEGYLRQYQGIVIVVSHDREFLNRICTHVADIDFNTIKIYSGNYDQFLESRALEEETRRAEAEKAEKRIGDLNVFITKYKAKASKARQAQSKAKMIERLEQDMPEAVYSSRIYPRIRFTSRRPSGRQVLNVRDIDKAFGDHQVLRGVSFDVFRNDKLAIIGPNGVGKSTLLKILVDHLGADRGTVEWGHETHVQYFSQDHREEIAGGLSVYEWLYQFAPGEPIGVIRGTLGNLLFSGDDADKPTSALSGGEAARLITAKLILLKGNVLLLDEPTNHLDMESIESLVEALKSFDGTLLFVSHNRYVVSHVATKILEIKPGGIDLFDGTYEEYLEKVGVDHLGYQVELANRAKKREKAPVVDYQKDKERRRKEAERRKSFNEAARELIAEGERLEAEIAALEAGIEAVNDLFSDPNYFTRTDPAKVHLENQKKRELEERLQVALGLWEETNIQIETFREKFKIPS